MKERVVIIGASITGVYTTTALVRNGFEGQITLIEKNNTFPFNTYPLSKEWMRDRDEINPPLLKKKDYYEKEKINLKLNTRVDSINHNEKTLKTNLNETIPYDKLVIATGSKLRRLNLPGNDAKGIFYLRNFDDAKNIKSWLDNSKNISIIGSGFIGLELASSFNQLGKNVSVLVRSGYPLEKTLGKEASDYFVNMHQAKGTNFIFGEEAGEFIKDDNGDITSILTKNKKNIKTDMLIIATGVKPNIPFELDVLIEDGCIVVDKYGQSSLENIYAGGDVVKWPYRDRLIHVEHWENAWSQGTSIAKNIINEKSNEYNVTPYFWTDQYDETFEYLGNTKTWAKTVIRGSLKDGQFAIAYLDDKNLAHAILFANGFEERNDIEKLLNKNQPLDEERFADTDIPLEEI